MRTRTGFTLVEILIVIAIIAIIAAILFPVFAQALEKARAVACISNLKQPGLAYTQYEQDYDEAMPYGLGASTGQGWAGCIYPYVKGSLSAVGRSHFSHASNLPRSPKRHASNSAIGSIPRRTSE